MGNVRTSLIKSEVSHKGLHHLHQIIHILDAKMIHIITCSKNDDF